MLRTIVKYSSFAVASLAQQGAWQCAADFVAEMRFDLRHGIETLIPRELDSSDISSSSLKDGVQYQGANLRHVKTLIRALPPESRKATFVDFGCGKGRVLLAAAEEGFTNLIGIEFSPSLAEVSRKNLQRSRRLSASVKCQVLTMDAAEYSIPSEPSVCFFYNPFGGATLRSVIGNLRKRADAGRQPLWVLYLSPKCLEDFLQADFKAGYELLCNGDLIGVILNSC